MTPGDNRVLNAINRGVSDPRVIAVNLHLSIYDVRQAIKRLMATHQIRRMNLGGYEPARKTCALEQTWK